MGKYPEYIMKKLRQRKRLEEDDTSMDEELNTLPEENVFNECCNWEGLVGCGPTIKLWIKDIYKIDLDDLVERNRNNKNQ